MLKRMACVALALAFLGGCQVGEKATQGELVDETVERHLTIEVTGDRTFEFDGVTKMRFLTRVGTGDLAIGSVASVSVPQMLKSGDGFVLPEVGIAARYKGDGDYLVGAGTGQAPKDGPTATTDPKTPPDVSLVQVTFIHTTPQPGEVRYGYLLEHCEVTLEDDARTGIAECPALVGIDGTQVALTMRWGKP